MHHLAAALHTLGVHLSDTATRRTAERGSVTIEQVVRILQDITRSDEEVVAVLEHLLRTKQVQRQAGAPA